MNNTANLAVQYNNDHDLQVRIATHAKYTVGANLETLVDQALGLSADESLLDIGTGPGISRLGFGPQGIVARSSDWITRRAWWTRLELRIRV